VNRQQVWLIITVYVTFLFFGIGGFLYIGHVDHQADVRNQDRAREFCDVIVLIDNRNQQVPPKLAPNPTAEQRQQYDVAVKFVSALHKYRLKLGC
jgi:hypothetical protein